MMRVVSSVVLTSVLLAASEPVFAQGAVTNAARPALWSGTVTAGAGPVGEIPECASGCARFDVSVSLPADVWQKSGGVQFAIRWISRTLGDNLRMFVYRNGVLVAKSDGIISTAQSVLVREPTNGVFNVYVAHDPDSPNGSIAYDGLAEVEFDARINPARLLAPDLEVRPHRNLGFDPGGVFFDAISEAYPTCYQSEVDEEGAKTCLRFDQIFANVGEGPLELRFAVPTGTSPAAATAVQRRYSSDPDDAPQDEPVGAVEFHAVHGHYHFASFGVSRLWAVDASKNKIKVVREHKQTRMFENAVVRNGRKVSFCLADIEIDSWDDKGRRCAQVQRAGLLVPELERWHHRCLCARHHQRLGRRLRPVPARSIHGSHRRGRRHLSAGDHRRS